ncbi:PfkB family carbohydrate kinase [Micromonospora sp. 4G57]|uniref:PfkB family carbohydrate kinase n=1 Tax=Micromonospora sicca TaxID=2202420 RepID=A0ABU5J700_9ACTN|nr:MULTISPECIES: PfkB family carbohydrate kinase [unclassified Micromonospora]MDZ5442956.1 PfkB family carbohydrate kinase [Micromonospora sp. 4G57]MDZ5488333.1 PfkB family carbohydrate kinase [Micromonospora sp. 4G53]
MAGLDAIAVGQVARDLVLLVDEVPGASRAALVRRRRELLGGKGANQAVGLAQLGARVGLLGVVGLDEVGDRLLGQARSDGIDVAPVVRREGTPSALIVDVVDAHGRWRYLEDIPEETLLTEADVAGAEDVVRAARAVLVQLQQPLPAALAAARCARAADRLVLLDGAPDDPDGATELLTLADVLRADAREAGLIVGDPPKDADAGLRAGRELLGRGPSLVAIEVAGEGNAFAWPGGELFVPLSETPTVDTTGAGDAFVAALTVGLLRGDPPERTARYAVAAAGATVGHPGGRPALSAAAIEEQLARIPAS